MCSIVLFLLHPSHCSAQGCISQSTTTHTRTPPLPQTSDPTVKKALLDATEQAVQLGMFGAPFLECYKVVVVVVSFFVQAQEKSTKRKMHAFSHTPTQRSSCKRYMSTHNAQNAHQTQKAV